MGGRRGSQLTQVTAYALVVVLAFGLAVWEAFFDATLVYGEKLPVAAVVAAVGNVVLGRAGGKLVAGSWGPIVPGVLWLLVVFPLGLSGSGGDVIVPADLRGWLLLGAGSVGIVVGAAAPRTTPSDPAGR